MAYSQYSRPKITNDPPVEDDQTGGSSASFSNWRTLINTAPKKRFMGRVKTTAVRKIVFSLK